GEVSVGNGVCNERMRPLDEVVVRLAADDGADLGVALAQLLGDSELEGVAGSQLGPAKAIAASEIVVAIPDPAVDRVWPRRDVLLRDLEGPGRRQHLTERAGEVPAAAQVVQKGVNGIARGKVRLTAKADGRVGHGDAQALLSGVLLVGRAELLRGIL